MFNNKTLDNACPYSDEYPPVEKVIPQRVAITGMVQKYDHIAMATEMLLRNKLKMANDKRIHSLIFPPKSEISQTKIEPPLGFQ